jgi:hypothetical protein
MDRPKLLRVLAVAALLGSGAAGCLRQEYRAETTLRPDGSLDRAIYQFTEGTPDEVQKPAAWTRYTYAPPPHILEREKAPIDIRQLPPHKPDKDHTYFAAWGTFKSVQDLPGHFVMKPPEGATLPDGKLKRDLVHNDFVFVREHLWRETLTEVIQFEDARKARDEAIELLIDVGQDAFNELHGKEYDAGDLVKWARTEGKTWATEVTDYLFITLASRRDTFRDRQINKDLMDQLGNDLADICARHGLKLKKNGQLLSGKDMEIAVEQFAIDLISKHVRTRKDGKLVDRAVVVQYFEQLRKKEKTEPDKPDPIEEAFKKVIAAKYGGEEAFEKRLKILATRIVGVYWVNFLPTRYFKYTMTVPGLIVETNGNLLSDNRVHWEFDTTEAYPFGREMRCRSLESLAQPQAELLKGQPLKGREEMQQYVTLVGNDEKLLEILRICRDKKSMTPLLDYRESAASGGETDQSRKVDRLLRLLQLKG